MPQILLLVAVGAGLLLVRRYLKKEQGRIASDLRKAEEAMAKPHKPVPLEQDKATGVYRPKRSR